MTLSPTWDLFVIAFFIVIISYSFVIGRNATIKVILSSYIAILASNGIGNFFSQYLANRPFMNFIPENYGIDTLAVFKMSVFIIITLLLVLKGAFEVHIADERSRLASWLVTMVYGFLSAGLILSTIMIYMTGQSLGGLTSGTQPATAKIEFISPIISSMINNYSLWFSLPVVAFVVASFFASDEGSENA